VRTNVFALNRLIKLWVWRPSPGPNPSLFGQRRQNPSRVPVVIAIAIGKRK
jgi:hypothetical protein